MTPVELGATREIWLAPLTNPTDKSSFLIRDDTYSRSGAVFGRTLRLGDPVDLGPNSTWRQTTWEGGRDQELWSDSAMYHKGNLDGTRKPGKLKLWPGWLERYANLNRAATRWMFASSAVGDGETVKLYMGESNPFYHARNDPTTLTPTPPDGFKLWRYDPVADTTTLVKNFVGQIQAVARLTEEKDDSFTWLVVGDSTGEIWTYNEDGDVWYEDVDTLAGRGAVGWNSIIGFNDATYIGQGQSLWRRTKTGPLISDLTYTKVKEFPGIQKFVGLEVWNSQLWIATVTQGNKTDLWVTDGTTVRHVIAIPEEFHAWGIKAHYGSLYLSGLKHVTPGNVGQVGVVWRYTGASLQRLWQDGEGTSGDNRGIYNLATWRQYLAWGRNASAQTDNFAGLMLYDAERDAILEGPGLDTPTGSNGIFVAGVCAWNDMLVAAFLDKTDYDATRKWPHVIASMRTDEGIKNDLPATTDVSFNTLSTGTRERWLYTSTFDGDLPGEEKVWLQVRLRYRSPLSAISLKLYAYWDDNTSGELVATFAPMFNWTTTTKKLKLATWGNGYPYGHTVRFRLAVEMNMGSVAANDVSPEIDTFQVDYMPKPIPRHSWRLRVVCSDTQKRLDGTPNPLTTAQAQADKIEELWAGGEPVMFWPPNTSGGVPLDANAYDVVLTDFLEQSQRIRSDDSGLFSEVSFGALEVVEW